MRSIRIIAPLMLLSIAAGQTPSASDQARNAITQGLTDHDPEVRREVALSMGLLGRKEIATAALKTLITDSDVPVRVAAISSAADLRDPRLIPQLKIALDDSVPEVAFAAAKALWALHQPLGKEVLLAILEREKKAESNLLRRKYRETMRAFTTRKGTLLFVLNQGVGFVPVPGIGEGFSALQSLLWETDFSPRASIAILLAKERDETTRKVLLNALEDSDWSVRAAAAQAIALRNQPNLRNELVPLFKDSNPKVRFRAATGYLRLNQMAAKPATPLRPNQPPHTNSRG